MSDALYDMDEDDGYTNYLVVLEFFLKNPTEENFNNTIDARMRVKETRVLEEEESFKQKTSAFIRNLQEGDEETWKRHLFFNLRGRNEFESFLSLSPFVGKTIITFDTHHGFSRDAYILFYRMLRDRGYTRHGNYLFVFDNLDKKNVEISPI